MDRWVGASELPNTLMTEAEIRAAILESIERTSERVDEMIAKAQKYGWDIFSPDEAALMSEVIRLREQSK